MENSVGIQLLIATVAWTLYLLIVFLVFNFLYLRFRGQAPRDSKATVILNGKPVSALSAWQARDTRLRRRFIAIGAAVMLLPLLMPFILSRLL